VDPVSSLDPTYPQELALVSSILTYVCLGFILVVLVFKVGSE